MLLHGVFVLWQLYVLTNDDAPLLLAAAFARQPAAAHIVLELLGLLFDVVDVPQPPLFAVPLPRPLYDAIPLQPLCVVPLPQQLYVSIPLRPLCDVLLLPPVDDVLQLLVPGVFSVLRSVVVFFEILLDGPEFRLRVVHAFLEVD